jgi:hypothetical protein
MVAFVIGAVLLAMSFFLPSWESSPILGQDLPSWWPEFARWLGWFGIGFMVYGVIGFLWDRWRSRRAPESDD